MSALDILSSKQQLTFALLAVFVVGLGVGQVLWLLNKAKAFKWAEWLDSRRKPAIKVLHRLLYKQRGTVKTTVFIFGLNLSGASLLVHTIGGLAVIFPFVHLFVMGLLVYLVVRRYPERLLIAAVVVPFEAGAFIVAATGGVSIGLSLWGGGEVVSAIKEWVILFSMLVVPLQFLNALFESILAHRLFVVQRHPWPEWLIKFNDFYSQI